MSQPANIDYQYVLTTLKDKIQKARVRAILSVNTQLMVVYWEIGKVILEQQKNKGWGAKIIENLATDLKIEFPDETGFSVRNLKYMKSFAEAYPDFITQQPALLPPGKKKASKKKGAIVQAAPAQLERNSDAIVQAAPAQLERNSDAIVQAAPAQLERNSDAIVQAAPAQLERNSDAIVQAAPAQLERNPSNAIVQMALAQLSWYHHTTLLDKVKNPDERQFYIKKIIENGWSRDVLVMHIENSLYQSQGRTINNFDATLPAYNSELIRETFKSPYILDFLTLAEDAREKDVERGLIQHLKKFMLELGRGFAYVGNQFNLTVADDEFFLDLLFYNVNLHCYVVFELKIGNFKPEHAGKLNFYINAIDGEIKGKKDNPTIGILLCKTPNDTVVKYALKGLNTPLGVADYEFTKALPKQLKGEIPSIAEFEAEIEKEYEELKSPSQKRFEALKEKLVQIKKDEIKQTATKEILFDIIDKSVFPLYKAIIQRIDVFKDWFYSNLYSFSVNGKDITDINELTDKWKNKELPTSDNDFHFTFLLKGFKKAGTEAFDFAYRLNIKFDTYNYSFTLMNYNNHQPFIKKLYHEQLKKDDINAIADTVFNKIMDDIERQIENLSGKPN